MNLTTQSSPTSSAASSLDQVATVVTAAPGQVDRSVGSSGTASVDPGSAPGEETGPGLRVIRGHDVGRRFALSAVNALALGRHPDCDVELADVTVSRRHAEIRPDRDQFLISDGGSLNGTYVNRRPVDTVTLSDGDEIAIGIFRLVFSAS